MVGPVWAQRISQVLIAPRDRDPYVSLCTCFTFWGNSLQKCLYWSGQNLPCSPFNLILMLWTSAWCRKWTEQTKQKFFTQKKNTIKIKMQDETTQKAKQNKANKSIGNICKHEQRRRMRGDEKEWRRLRKEGYCYLQRHSRTYTPSRNLECLGEIHSTSEELNRIHIFTQVSQFIWHQKLLESSMIELEHHCISDTKPKMLICAASTSEDCLI